MNNFKSIRFLFRKILFVLKPLVMTILLVGSISQTSAQPGQLVIYVKAGNVPLQGVSLYYTCTWAANLGAWTSWNSGITDANGEIVTPMGENLSNVQVEVGNIPWALQQLYGNTAYPSEFTFPTLTQTDTIEFNLNPIVPQIQILQPATSTLNLSVGSSLTFEADIQINSPYLIDSVFFEIDGQPIPGIAGTGNAFTSASGWSPSASDFYQNHILNVTVYGSNGTDNTLSHTFYLGCTGANCPNQLPVISWLAPVSTTINQPNGFAPIDILVELSDVDGSIVANQISINGSQDTLIHISNNQYGYTFTPSSYTTYQVIIEAIDNDNDTSSIIRNININNSTFVPLPPKVIVGYWHSWDNASAPFMYLSEVDTSHFNVVVYSFIETINGDGFTPQLTINTAAYQTGGQYDPQLLKDDIQSLQSLGIPVLVSIGGQNGHVELNTLAQKDTFVQGVIDIVEEYGFDGIDMDFEGGSMNFGGGSLSDFSYATISNGSYPKLKNVIDAFTEIDDYFGAGFHLTSAPELFYVQVGYSTYSDMAGSFLPVIDNLRNKLDYIHVQLYNSGSVMGLDNVAYSTGNANFIVAMTDMLLKGFDVSTTGIHFNALNESQVAIGLPACTSAAPAGGYVSPAGVVDALDYLTQGISFGGSYNTQGAVYPNLRGAMTWSVNWDKAANCGSEWEYSNNIFSYFNGLSADTVSPVAIAQNTTLYLDASGHAPLTTSMVDNGSYDNSGITSMELSQYSFDCQDIGINQIQFSVFDAAGNSDNAQANVEVLDTVSPIAIAQNITTDLDSGFAQIDVADVNLNSSDNCQIDTMTLSQSTFTTPGTYTVLFTVEDGSGNSTVVELEVTVNLPVGMENVARAEELLIWPNPFNREKTLHIKSGKPVEELSVWTMQGVLLSQQTPKQEGVDLSLNLNLSADVYLIKIRHKDGTIKTKKLIVL